MCAHQLHSSQANVGRIIKMTDNSGYVASLVILLILCCGRRCISGGIIIDRTSIVNSEGSHAMKLHGTEPVPSKWGKFRARQQGGGQQEIQEPQGQAGSAPTAQIHSTEALIGGPGSGTCTHHMHPPSSPDFAWMSTEATRQLAQVSLGNRARLRAAMDRLINQAGPWCHAIMSNNTYIMGSCAMHTGRSSYWYALHVTDRVRT